ncbi:MULTISPECIES: DUF5703 family protein [Streptomycetaceae]|uniref:DUF5703 family protein n=1 Tax=Streptodolium elevatio TaxID=3157996 RepID=A0ABV3DT66_9ACTN
MQGTEPNTGTRTRVGGTQYEFQQLHLPRGTSRSDARRILTEQAEYGLWELERLTIRRDGSRRVLLRRRIIRQLRLT